MRLVCALGLFLALLHLSTSLWIGAFNIQSFGDTKAKNTAVMDIIRTIVHRYDIILIQEVRDSGLSVTQKLVDHVNRAPSTYTYRPIVSEPLGRKTYQERYLFLYREETVSMDGAYVYPDTTDAFMREPFIVKFSSILTDLKNLVLIPQHTSPNSAVDEINALYDVVTHARNHWKSNNIMLLGDFNAGGTYVKNTDWPRIRLFDPSPTPNFRWLISDSVDTTVSRTNKAYDRIVVMSALFTRVVPGSANVHIFTPTPGIQASDVSDHYPVEVELS